MGEVAQEPTDRDAPTDKAVMSSGHCSRQEQPACCLPAPGRSQFDEPESLNAVYGPSMCSVRELFLSDRADPASLKELRLQADDPWSRSTDQDCQLLPGEERVPRHEREHLVNPVGPSPPLRIMSLRFQAHVGSTQHPRPERGLA